LGRIGMDASMRVVLEFTRNDFFRKPVDSPNQAVMIYGGTEAPAYFLSGTGRSTLNRTMCFTINGPKAEELTNKTEQEIAAQILAEMDEVFEGKGTLNVRKYPADHARAGEIICAVKDWTQELYIQGGQSYPLPGGTNEDRVALAEAIDGKLFFAGEATDMTGDFGTVNGAIKSASRAAEEVIAAIVAENATPAS
jgi:monoamine oxidase